MFLNNPFWALSARASQAKIEMQNGGYSRARKVRLRESAVLSSTDDRADPLA